MPYQPISKLRKLTVAEHTALAERLAANPAEALWAYRALCEETPVYVREPSDGYHVVAPLLADSPVERFVAVALNRRNRVLACEVMTVGSDAHCIVDPKGITRWALLQGKSGAHAVIVAHNHPSGDPEPSAQDLDATRQLCRALRTVGIQLLDHLIVVGPNHTSFATRGLL